jgi:hypothetical protein
MVGEEGAPIGSVIVFEAGDLAEARAIAARDAYVTFLETTGLLDPGYLRVTHGPPACSGGSGSAPSPRSFSRL